MKKTSLVPTLAAASIYSAAFAVPAQAHIDLLAPLSGRGGTDQKTSPCGAPRRSSTPATFEPGATITLGVAEGIPHDGYFRISFDNDGQDDFEDPKSIDPINPNRYGIGKKCEGTAADQCGESDFCNVVSKDGGPTVLWDKLDRHLGGDSKGNYTWTVKLPDIECDNCTIQIQQIMEDPAAGFHGPFDGEDDLYYRCVDIVLKKGATASPGVATGPAKNDGIDCLASAGGGTPLEPSAPAGEGKSDASAPTTGDAGIASSRDAGSSGGNNTASKPTEENDSEDDEAPAAGAKADAGKPTTTKVDASTAKKDAGAGDHADHDDDHEDSDDEENDDDAEGSDQPAATDDGCSISAGSASTKGWSFALTALLTTALVTIRRRRSR